jgi:uncharacterized OB-fold protein
VSTTQSGTEDCGNISTGTSSAVDSTAANEVVESSDSVKLLSSVLSNVPISAEDNNPLKTIAVVGDTSNGSIGGN